MATRYFIVLDQSSLKDSVFTGEPASAARKAASKLIGKINGSKTVTIKVQERGTDKVWKYEATKTKLKKPFTRKIQDVDGKTKEIKFEYDTTVVAK